MADERWHWIFHRVPWGLCELVDGYQLVGKSLCSDPQREAWRELKLGASEVLVIPEDAIIRVSLRDEFTKAIGA